MCCSSKCTGKGFTMFKKMLLAAVAVVVGLSVVRHTQLGSLAKVWWRDARTQLERTVPPETQIKQLRVEIDAIDQEIAKNLSILAEREVAYGKLEQDVAALKQSQDQRRDDIRAMMKELDSKSERVTFNNRSMKKSDLSRSLDTTTSTYNSKKGELKSKEQLLEARKEAIETAHSIIGQMRDQKEEMLAIAANLETQIEKNRLQQLESRVAIDTTHVDRCRALIAKIKERLDVAKKETELKEKYGIETFKTPAVEKDRKSTAEVIQAAQKALEENAASDKVASEK